MTTDTKLAAPSPFSRKLPAFQIAEMEGIHLTAKRLAAFCSKLVEDGECWIYTGPKTHNGYGTFGIGGRKGTNIRAHRLAHVLWKGPIPVAQMVLHSCDNRACCNPDHLFTGTAKDNTSDMMNKGRAKYVAHTRWTEQDGETAIKYRRKFWSAQSIGNMLGFSHETVRSFLISVGEWR